MMTSAWASSCTSSASGLVTSPDHGGEGLIEKQPHLPRQRQGLRSAEFIGQQGVARQIVRKQVIAIDNSPGKRALARHVHRDLRSERSASDQDRAAAVGDGVPRHRGGEFAVEARGEPGQARS